jgi:hypothetical protein
LSTFSFNHFLPYTLFLSKLSHTGVHIHKLFCASWEFAHVFHLDLFFSSFPHWIISISLISQDLAKILPYLQSLPLFTAPFFQQIFTVLGSREIGCEQYWSGSALRENRQGSIIRHSITIKCFLLWSKKGSWKQVVLKVKSEGLLQLASGGGGNRWSGRKSRL